MSSFFPNNRLVLALFLVIGTWGIYEMVRSPAVVIADQTESGIDSYLIEDLNLVRIAENPLIADDNFSLFQNSGSPQVIRDRRVRESGRPKSTESSAKKPEIRLTALITVHGTRKALLETSGRNAEQKLLKTGESIGIWQLVEIKDSVAIVRSRSRTLNLDLNEYGAPPVPRTTAREPKTDLRKPSTQARPGQPVFSPHSRQTQQTQTRP